jgi:hypothetical protein
VVRCWQHVNEPSSSIIHGSLIGALSPFVLVYVFNPLEHEAKRVVGVVVTAGAYPPTEWYINSLYCCPEIEQGAFSGLSSGMSCYCTLDRNFVDLL